MYNSNINLNLYKTFLVVAKSKSLSDASNKMNMEKPSISRNIKQLEDTLGIKLFYRNTNGMKLTAEGEELFEFVDKSFSLLETGEKIVHEKNDLSTGDIVIGSLSHISAFYVMDCVEKAKKDFPNLKIEIITGATGNNLISLLENHKIDFAIDSTVLEIANKDIQVQELKKIDNIFISKNPIEITDLKQLEEYEYILGSEYSTTVKELTSVLKNENVTLNQTLKIDITELKINAVKRGLGIGYVMKDSVKKELENKEVYEVKVPIELPKSKINLINLKGHLTKADKKFIKEYLKK